ncbi:ATP-dependent sacrificial sulfur transferase LarE [Candidatus Omnitrophota bacterium]
MLKKKLDSLTALLEQMRAAVVCYSAGADSSLLLKIAQQVLGGHLLAVTADSPVLPPEQLRFSRRMTKEWGVRHTVIHLDILNTPAFIKNPLNRCYYCKRMLFGQARAIASRRKIHFVLDGTNASDSRDFRPGSQARKEFGVRSPLEECAINKQDVYKLSKSLRLPTWNKPPTVCLASRIPYGQQIILKDLKMVQRAEDYIRRFGFRQVRLRHYNLNPHLKLACIELDKKNISYLAGSLRFKVQDYLKRLGYDYVTLDLEGYRCGSLHKFVGPQHA